MKRLLLILNLLCCSLTYAQDRTYSIDYAYETLNSNCNVFASAVTVDNLVHKTTIGFPNFSGPTEYYINLPCRRSSQSSQVGTEYQVIFPFKKGYQYQITAYYRGSVTGSDNYPMLTFDLNETEKTHNTATSCTGPQNVSATHNYFGGSGSSFAWIAPGNIYSTGVLTTNYASLSVGSFPHPISSGNDAIHIRNIVISEFCNNPGIPTGLSGTLTPQTSGFGYTLNFTGVSDAVDYQVEWYDVTTNSLANTFTISGSGYLYTGFTLDHTYKYRVRARNECNHYSAFSDWSPELVPPVGTCQNGPLGSTLSVINGCYPSPTCSNLNLNWVAVPGAVQYKVEYFIINVLIGAPKPPVTLYSSSPSVTTSYALASHGWVIQYHVAVDCGSGYGNYSAMSEQFYLY